MKWTATGAVLVALAGCGATVTPDATPVATGAADTCNAAAYAGLVGQDAVQALTVPDPKRSYRPDEGVTTDFIPERVNIQLDDTDTIIAISCG